MSHLSCGMKYLTIFAASFKKMTNFGKDRDKGGIFKAQVGHCNSPYLDILHLCSFPYAGRCRNHRASAPQIRLLPLLLVNQRCPLPTSLLCTLKNKLLTIYYRGTSRVPDRLSLEKKYKTFREKNKCRAFCSCPQTKGKPI